MLDNQCILNRYVGFDYEKGEPYSADFHCATSNRKDGVVYIWKEVDGIYYILNISMLKLQSKIHEDATVLSLRLMILMTYSCH
ncbi:MAG: hypothetical protein KH100_13180 [Dysgonomonas mossii]|uniref:hypothetical protein n=1 Tax=Dysgonomonas mossii TaxID=163665 RepID=UPI001DEB6277|nr:hypothetical protein [Dysgonomonas mossii]MBS7112132.1 hypothetical protein [Dysgonomonas mossii]